MAFHHSLTDGVGGVDLASELFDLERTPAPRDDGPPAVPEPMGGWKLLRDTFDYDVHRVLRTARRLPSSLARSAAAVTRHPWGSVRTATSVARTVEPYFRTLSPVMRERRLDRALRVIEVPLRELHDAGAAHGGHLNDAFLAAVTGGLRRYHDRHGAAVRDLRVTLPISLRGPDDPAGGNRITLMRCRLTTEVEHPAERVWFAHRVVEGLRAERSLAHTQGIAAALNLLPAHVVGSMLKHVDLVLSDVPGVPVRLYLAGSRVEAWYPFGPTIGAAVNVTLMSYVDTCCIGVNIDTGAVPDPELLTSCLREGFDEVLALARPADADL
jgi:diacylglycerol O-acyltransferase